MNTTMSGRRIKGIQENCIRPFLSFRKKCSLVILIFTLLDMVLSVFTRYVTGQAIYWAEEVGHPPIVPDLINFLAEKSSQNGLILEKVNLDKISSLEKNSKIQKISLSLSLSGFYPALRNFISILQKSAKLIEIDSIIFSESKTGGVFSFNLKIKTYSY